MATADPTAPARAQSVSIEPAPKRCPRRGGGRCDEDAACDSCDGTGWDQDAARGMAWLNGLTKPERARWLDIAWRRNERVAGRHSYTLEDMPSAADAWAAWKVSREVWP